MQAHNNLVYIAGHSRGGTTWLGSLFALHSEVAYVFEPFASQAHPFTGIDTKTIFNNNREYLRGKLHREVEYPSPHFFNMSARLEELEVFVPLVRLHAERVLDRLGENAW